MRPYRLGRMRVSFADSIRSANHVKEAALAGADVATIPSAVIKGLANHALTEIGLDQFARDWAAT